MATSSISKNMNNVYSTSEINTGKTWIDGKPIYRKVVSVVINDRYTNVPFSVGQDKITFYYGLFIKTDGSRITDYYWNDNDYARLFFSNITTIAIRTDPSWVGATANIILEYTKP